MERRYRESQTNKIEIKIRNARYNKWYAYVRSVGMLKYFERGEENKWQRVVKFKLRCEMREMTY